MHIYDYVCSHARRITDAAPRELGTPEQWWQQRPDRVKQFYEMMGLPNPQPKEERLPVKATVTGVLKRKGHRVENLYFETMPRLYVAGNLYVPTNPLRKRLPAVLYLSGHSESPRAYYQAHPRRLAQLGFVALAIDTIHLGELEGYHHGPFKEGWWHWYSRGYTPAGVELFNAIRAIDFLQSLPYVDSERIGATGISGGGATSWWLAAGDERIACVAPVCATGTFASQVIDRTIDGQCDCMFPINSYGWDLIDIAALVAPRPCLIVSADCDRIFTVDSIREFHGRLKRVYDMAGVGASLALVETRGRHTYRKRSRLAVFSWFLKHLSGTDIPALEVGDIDPVKDEPEDLLQVFTSGTPPDEATTTIQDTFIKLAEPPVITNPASLSRHRDSVIGALREKTFAHFPSEPCQLDLRVEFRWALEDRHGISFSFVSEDDYRLWANMFIREGVSDHSPALVTLRNAGDNYSKSGAFRDFLPDWAHADIEVRGTGRTSWGQDLQWYL